MTEFQQKIDSEEISLKEFIKKFKFWINHLKKKRKLILIFTIIFVFIGFFYSSFQKIKYTAISTFILEEDNGSGLNGAMGLASSIGFDIGGGSGGGLFSGSNIMELMKSRLMVEKTLLNPVNVAGKEISLAEYYIQINELKEAWNDNPKLSNISFPINADRSKFNLEQDSILEIFSKNLIQNNLSITKKDIKANIITLIVKMDNELFSKFFCEQLLKETSDFYIETKSKKAKLNTALLQHQADSIRTELNLAINGVASALDNVYNLNPAFNIKRTPSTSRQIDVQANTAVLNQLVTQLEIAKVSLRKETPLIQLIDSPILPLEKDKVGKFKSSIIGAVFGLLISILYLTFEQFYKKMIK
jgi:hypothetical protein